MMLEYMMALEVFSSAAAGMRADWRLYGLKGWPKLWKLKDAGNCFSLALLYRGFPIWCLDIVITDNCVGLVTSIRSGRLCGLFALLEVVSDRLQARKDLSFLQWFLGSWGVMEQCCS